LADEIRLKKQYRRRRILSTLVVNEYNPTWPAKFVEERQRLQAGIGEFVEEIHHIGSTSVAGLAAKPIIDLLVVVPNLSVVPHCILPLECLGYSYQGEGGIAGRHFFRKPPHGFERDFHIHLMERSNEQYEFHLLFRDYLQAHSEARQAYAALKKELAARFGSDRTSYTAAKQDFIRLLIQRAREEKAQVSREAHPPDQ
jgi:GrpB-like predicted nucleotidyltransferase (UPF0157 family)